MRQTSEIGILRSALVRICHGAPKEEPMIDDWNGNPDDQYSNGCDRANWFTAEIARDALKSIGHLSDCSLHNEPEKPNEECDCILSQISINPKLKTIE